MTEYICKTKNCNKQYTIMGYCDTHWQEVKSTWTPSEMISANN